MTFTNYDIEFNIEIKASTHFSFFLFSLPTDSLPWNYFTIDSLDDNGVFEEMERFLGLSWNSLKFAVSILSIDLDYLRTCRNLFLKGVENTIRR